MKRIRTDEATARRLSAPKRLASEIARRIASGVYSAHSYLPAEREIADDYGVGRGTVAAALGALAKEGLVVRTRGRGTRVLPAHERLSQNVIAVVRSLPAPTAEADYIIEGIQQVLSQHHYRYEVIYNLWPWDNAPVEPARTVTPDTMLGLAERYGALIFIETLDCPEQILELEKRKVPVVVANLEVDLDVSATWVDHWKTTFQAVQIFAALGHRRIALVSRPFELLYYSKAHAGYLDGLKEAGIPRDDSLVATSDDLWALAGYTATQTLLKLPDRPTAIVATRDYMAEGACRAIAEAGLVAGRDISVIGFDDISWRRKKPLLTTFREPCAELGKAAAEMLAERVVGGWRPPEKREIEAPLIIRRSAGPWTAADEQGTLGVALWMNRPPANKVSPSTA